MERRPVNRSGMPPAKLTSAVLPVRDNQLRCLFILSEKAASAV